jgi:uncharacterized LabA/DUF88 family protein
MAISTVKRVALFVDGAAMHAAAKALGFDIDYKRLLTAFECSGPILRAFYYTKIVEGQEHSSLRPLIDWLAYNGYTVVTKAVREFADPGGQRRIKTSMNVELCVNAMELAGYIDEMVLFSGDGDFCSLVEAMQRRGVLVTVVSSVASQPMMIADELRRQADVFVDLAELRSRIERQGSDRPVLCDVRFLRRNNATPPDGNEE